MKRFARFAVALAIMIAACSLLAIPGGSVAMAQIGALTTDCQSVGRHGDAGYQFVATCAGRAPSPNNRMAIVQRAYREKQPTIILSDAQGRTLTRLASISDDMPFTVLWSANSRWFAVNHHVGSFMDELRLFEIVNRGAVERLALAKAAIRIATGRYRCLSPKAVLPNAVRWSADGNRLMLVTISSLYACSDTARVGDWWPLWMIGDVRTARIDPASVRVDKADGPLRVPQDKNYRNF